MIAAPVTATQHRPVGDERWGDGFGIFPLLLTELDAGVYHINLLPDTHPDILFGIAEQFADRIGLRVRLCSGSAGIEFNHPESEYWRMLSPRAGSDAFFAEALKLPCDLEADPQRREELARFLIQSGSPSPRLNPIHRVYTRLGGHEYLRFEWNEGRIPPGLRKCRRCDEYRGVMVRRTRPFPGNMAARPEVGQIRCRCSNANRCARCGRRLSRHGLQSYRFDESLGKPVYVTGLWALGHQCRAGAQP